MLALSASPEPSRREVEMEEDQNQTYQNLNSTPPVSPVVQTPPDSNQKPKLSIATIIGIILFFLVLGSVTGFYYFKQQGSKQVACTMEAKVCPDGTSVGRSGPKCEFAPCPTSSTPSPTPDPTATWKTYRNKEGLFRISYPPLWSENSSEGQSTFGENRIDIGIIVWDDGSTEYAEARWKQIDCAQGTDTNGGCSPSYNTEEKKFSLNSYTVYFKIDGRGQIHAYIPNRAKNKTVEIYSVYLTDRKVFDQILSTFRFD